MVEDIEAIMEIITDAMVEKALDAFFEVEGWRSEKLAEEALLRQDMRRTLATVAPLFAEQFAKIADEQAAEFRKRHVIARDPNRMAVGAEGVARAIRATKAAEIEAALAPETKKPPEADEGSGLVG